MGISVKQFEEMQKRLGASRSPSSNVSEVHPTANTYKRDQIILGIDPSLRGTGFGIVHTTKTSLRAIAFGTIKCPATWEPSRCLLNIATRLRDEIKKHSPTVCVIEGIFFAQNLQTAMTMGQARGAAMVAAAEGGLEIYEIATRKVKLAIVGFGGAQKTAVAKMVQRMLKLSAEPDPDAADALALALVHAQEQSRYQLTPRKKI